MDPEDEKRARQLFFDYDGSPFYMWNDGVDDEYKALNVAERVEREWMAEITARHMEALDHPGNWKTIHFLSHHSDYSQMRRVLQARPRGVWWEQLAYLEHLLDYVAHADVFASREDRAAAARIAIEYGDPLLAQVAALPSEQSDRSGTSTDPDAARAQRLLTRARDFAAPPLLSVGIKEGGPTAGDPLVPERLASLQRTIIVLRDRFPNSGLRLNIVFHVPGAFFKPDYAGVHATRLDRKNQWLLVVAAVPDDLKAEGVSSYAAGVLRAVLGEARRYLTRRKVAIPMDSIDALVTELLTRQSDGG